MRERPDGSNECAAACEAISLRLDSQLSEVEQVLLEAHLARCGDCRVRAEAVVRVTEAIRSAPLVEPSMRFQLPRRDARRQRVLRLVPAAAAIAAVGLSGIFTLHLTATRARTATLGEVRELMGFKERQLQQLDSTSQRKAQGIRPSLAEQATLGSARTSRPPTQRSSGHLVRASLAKEVNA